MAKYRVECGALVTKLMQRTFTIHANSEEEAIEKAKERFDKACDECRRYTETGATVQIDNIEKLD